MAQAYKPGSDTDPANETDPQRPGFHYYSGGEVKELENTRVSPLLWGFWSLVILGALGYLFYGGALGPRYSPTGGFKPTSGSATSLAAVQTQLNTQAAVGNSAKQADMTQLVPFLGGDTLATAVEHGSNTYQSYCIGCHGPNQDGNGVNSSSLNPKPRNLHDGPFMRETLNYNRINTSLHYGVHGTAMPRWENTLSEHEIQEVIAYVLSLTWNMPAKGTDTTSAQLATPPGMTSPPANAGMAEPGKSPSGSVTGTAGGSSVRGGSVSNSPAPITPEVEGNPAAATSTAPPSQSGQSTPGAAGSVNTNAPTDQTGGTQAPPTAAPASGGAAPGGM